VSAAIPINQAPHFGENWQLEAAQQIAKTTPTPTRDCDTSTAFLRK
jgi:hypothetical protein